MTAANVYQQRPDNGSKAESPLTHAGFADLVGKGAPGAGVILRERKLLGHLVLRGDSQDPAFVAGVSKAVGLEFPAPLSVVIDGERSLQWIGPDEFLLVVATGEEFATEQALRKELDGQHIQVVNVSGGQTLVEMTGANVRDVLMKSSDYDVHPSNFTVGKAVGTHFAKTQLYIRRTGEETWELVVRRSFADYIWAWLQDASAEFGLSIKG